MAAGKVEDGEDDGSGTNVLVDEDGVMWGEDDMGRFRIDDKVWTMNEIRDHPLFMTDMPSDISDNPHLMALQSIMYDDQSPEELAQHFKNQGNEAMKFSASKIALQNALTFYTRGLEMQCKDDKLNSLLHSNRAAVSLKLGEHTKCIDDCRRATRLDASNLKAHFRGARASEALGLTDQGLKFCEGALRLDPQEPEVLRIQKQLLHRQEKEEAARQDVKKIEQEAAKQRKTEGEHIAEILALRGSRLGPPLFDMSMYALANGGRIPGPKLMEEDDGGRQVISVVQWPLLLLYDECNQSDFVASFDERASLEEQLQLMFPEDRPVEWDEQGKYVWHRLVAYLEYYPEDSSKTSLFKVSSSSPLWEVLQNRCLPPCLVFHVLVDGSPAHTVFVKNNTIT